MQTGGMMLQQVGDGVRRKGTSRVLESHWQDSQISKQSRAWEREL